MSVEYSDFFLNNPIIKAKPESLVPFLLLGMARIFPILTLSPFFGAKVLPHPVKVTLGLCIYIIALPSIILKAKAPLEYDTSLIACFLKEFLIGNIMGLMLSLPFFIVSTSGTIIDHQRGAASLMVNDPTIQNQTSPLGNLFNMLLIIIFYGIDGPFMVIDALLKSYDVLPPQEFISALFFNESNEIWQQILKAFQVFIALSLQLCAPSLIAILMTDTFLGIINRLAPQVQITFLAMGLKSWLALLIVLAGWKLFIAQLMKEMTLWMESFGKIVQCLNIGLSTIAG